MATKKLAKELGLLRKRSRPSNENHEERIHCRQLFSYLIVIDFESTCWRDKNNYGQEIIEFPAVLLNTANGKIDSEFHTYVQPQEHPILSKFCTELTGIQQAQVEAGVPLQICLSQFTRWIQTMQQEKNIVFIKEKNMPLLVICVLLSPDWDLGVCLQYECKRKQVCKPDILNSWIDLRATYKNTENGDGQFGFSELIKQFPIFSAFYHRKPKGLNGALQDLGIEFSGREHSGLDDARNTAHLAWRMITDGCLMEITRSLDKALLRTKPLFQMNPNTANVGGHYVTEEGVRKRVIKQPMPVSCEKEAQSSGNKRILEMCSNPEIFQYQSLVLPKTLLHRSSTPVKGKTSVPACQLGSKGSPLSVTVPLLHNNGLVLVSTTVDCNKTVPELDTDNPATLLDGWEGTPFLVESEESCSYDDVLLEDNDASATPFVDSCMSHDSNGEQLNVDGSVVNASNGHSIQIVFRNSNTTVYSLEKARTFPSGSGVFKTPLLSNGKLGDKIMSRSNIPCSANAKVTCAKEKSQRSGHCMTTPSSSFTIYKDEDDSCISTESRLSSGGLSSVLSANSMFLPSRGTMKMTSPLCTCGRRAKRLTVANGGPNHGRVFFSCPVGKMGSGNRKSCGFFKWESSLLKAKTVSASAYTSLCSVPGASFISSGKSFVNKSLHISPHKKFVVRPSLRN